MANLIQANDIGSAWNYLLTAILEIGDLRSPRGMVTKEIRNMTLQVDDGLDNIINCRMRNLNYKFMIAEWLWILSASEELNLLTEYNSKMAKFSDDGLILNGAYGPRLMPQIPYIIETLKKLDSRQAVSTIWTPIPAESKDVPCTISLQWLIRDNKLHCTINMRSSDAWLGIPYDFFNFSQVSNCIAGLLEISLGSITMNLCSSHLYESDFIFAETLLNEGVIKAIRSPQFTKNCLVTREILLKILRKESGEYIYPWNHYAKALQGKNLEALEVLHGLTTLNR